MQPVTIYSKSWCPYCNLAKGLLKRKGVAFLEIDVEADRKNLAEMITRAEGRSTVPQIFVGSTHVGGCDDLHAMESAGKLDMLLAA